MTQRLGLLMIAGMLLLPLPVLAIDRFEIQVYDSDINDPGHFGLELHANYTPLGLREGDYPGQIPPHGAFRTTLEPAIGVTEWLEVAGYLQMLVAPDVGAQWGGAKIRAKFVVPAKKKLPLHLGLNVEVGAVPHSMEASGWANEFRPIVAWTNGVWWIGFNPIFGYALTGPDAFKPELEPCGKVAWNTQRGFQLGAEYYSGLGLIPEGFSPLSAQEHLVFLTFDLASPKDAETENPWELNVGVGHGLTSGTSATWEVKTIVGRGF